MTRKGKCDVCRVRKVKCDEGKPSCGPCQLGKRTCSYYGKPKRSEFKFVVEDPNQYTNYGRSKVVPIVYPLTDAPDDAQSGPSSSQDPAGDVEAINEEIDTRLASMYDVEFLSRSRLSATGSTESPGSDRQVQRLRSVSSMPYQSISPQPSPAGTNLATRFIRILSPHDPACNPFVAEASWITSIPGRIGSSTVLDSAIQFSLDSLNAQKNPTASNAKAARRSKGRAIEVLRNQVHGSSSVPPLNVVLSIILHMYGEMFLNDGSLLGLFQHGDAATNLLRLGDESWRGDPDFWNVIFTAYEAEVGSGLYTDRRSKYDTPFFLAATNPRIITPDLNHPSDVFRLTSMALMHVWIQIPRLNCLVRDARAGPFSLRRIAAAISHAESLWEAEPSKLMASYLAANTTTRHVPPSQEINDVVSTSLHFDSIQALRHLLRYWLVRNLLCGLTLALYQSFPAQATASLLPRLDDVREMDVRAAHCTAQSVPWALSAGSAGLGAPMVPFCVHSPLVTSTLPWLRKTKRLREAARLEEEGSERRGVIDDEAASIQRVLDWLLHTCAKVQERWGFPRISQTECEITEGIVTGGLISPEVETWRRVRRNRKRRADQGV
ncbi:hypothetical protein BU24DRAFT_420941 [Aaosphaeria arxii CBS 175.79]|uniref:Zn(2)-C6 fungal-type domain-containing protein n=1 Tax=Aaosphaeria arxii CBS 175.79 TaxID=1450172 RepID=A0A6A5XXJ9_9PLEO|nr:uncharacterized protein BU24DRAFT_420941 [Aaosphaeria arxii CBS 175.79]KAF2017882.1 hypothetical protein BU24DRAFT_420941 [Aaosphaeria arxii CBS 175.79]